jgi:hypothetical protein
VSTHVALVTKLFVGLKNCGIGACYKGVAKQA